MAYVKDTNGGSKISQTEGVGVGFWAKIYYLARIFAEECMKMKEIRRWGWGVLGGGVWGCVDDGYTNILQ